MPMRLVFIYGQVASGKLTIGRELAALTGLPLFHNHLVVDAVSAVFPFGSEPFVGLRERLWLEVIAEAATAGRSIIFTFAPESTVDESFPERVRALVRNRGGEVLFVRLLVAPDEQERRLMDPSRTAFGKLRSPELLRCLREDFARCMAVMPAADVTIDTGTLEPRIAAGQIADLITP
ncbi:MAG TPA: shikimate kinase [Acetobacteraceae bacterium]|jgi:hypothetical protein|nr:shikimate kinase [Acetobacteraceae bacterium]